MRRKKRGNPVNVPMLQRIISISRSPYKIRKADIARELGVSYQTLQNKLTGDTEFTMWEAKTLAEALDLTKAERDAIFFGD